MRLRYGVPASALAAAACAVAPGIANAAPHPVHNRALSIHATPGQVVAGDPVLIYGRLQGRHSSHQIITLWHRINPAKSFTKISRTRTDAAGRYVFTRAEGVVESNRNWYVQGPVHSHSKTIHERVAAEVTLSSSAAEGTTRHPLTFSGHVTPNHQGSRIALQVQQGNSDHWRTVKTTRVGAGSNYSVAYAFRSPGARNVRASFAGDNRNIAAVSDPAAVVIDQRQAPYFSIATSSPIVANGSAATISGTLDKPHTSTPEANTTVQLYARPAGTKAFKVVQSTTTGADGKYSFTVQDTTNALYQARTASSPAQASAVVFQGVQDALTFNASSSTSTVGQSVTLSGTVAPDKSGEVIYLQKLGRDGNWHTVEVRRIHGGSSFSFGWTFGTAGTKQFRARIIGDGVNVGGASAAASVNVSQPPVSTLKTD